MLKILFVTSEVTPFSKSGGLGEVAAALPKELCKQGVDCRVVAPRYRWIPDKFLEGLVYVKGFETSLNWRKQHASVYQIERDGVIVYLIGNDYYFGRDGYYGYGDDCERFGFFSKAAVELAAVVDFKPDIIHANDWQTGLAAVYLRDKLSNYVFYTGTRSLFTIHNLQYQGVFGRGALSAVDLDDGYFSGGELEFYNNISLLKAGIVAGSAVSTVSETYAREITTPAYGFSMDGVIRSRCADLYGIVNGIDYERNNPATDRLIFKNYDQKTAAEGKAANKAGLRAELNFNADADAPLFSVVSRLTDQKGFDIVDIIMDEFLSRDVQLIILGQGDGRYEQMFNYYSWKYPGKCYMHVGFSDDLAQKIYAASDFFLMPSLFEPCGLGQLTAMRYGTLPIVRKTGGLADTVRHFSKADTKGNGFAFDDYLASGLMWAINEAMSVYGDKALLQKAINNAMSKDYSWGSSARQYIELYEKIAKK